MSARMNATRWAAACAAVVLVAIGVAVSRTFLFGDASDSPAAALVFWATGLALVAALVMAVVMLRRRLRRRIS